MDPMWFFALLACFFCYFWGKGSLEGIETLKKELADSRKHSGDILSLLNELEIKKERYRIRFLAYKKKWDAVKPKRVKKPVKKKPKKKKVS